MEAAHAEPGLQGALLVLEAFFQFGATGPQFGVARQEPHGLAQRLGAGSPGGVAAPALEVVEQAQVGPGLAAGGVKLGGLDGGGHAGLQVAGFHDGLGEPELGLGAAGHEGDDLAVEGGRPLGVVTSAPALQGPRLDHEEAGILRDRRGQAGPPQQGDGEGGQELHGQGRFLGSEKVFNESPVGGSPGFGGKEPLHRAGAWAGQDAVYR